MAKLKRELGLIEIILCGVGIILGAGIYVLIGTAAGIAGNSLWMSFLFGAIIAALTGLSYAELSSLFPKADAEHEYTKEAFSKMPKGIGSFVAFITGWMVVASGIFAGSTVAIGFSRYFISLFNMFPLLFVSAIVILVISFIMFYGIKQSAIAASIMTLIEGGGLVLIIVAGLPFLGSVDYFEMANGFQGVLSAAALIFFAYIGFEEIVRLAEETKNPQKTLPRALFISIIISTVLYVLVAISAVSLLPWQQLASSSAPMADAISTVLGYNGFLLLSVIALFSTFNTVLLSLLSTSRVAFGMGRDKSLPKMLSKIHNKRKTPWVSIGTVCLIAIIAALFFDMEIIAGVTDFLIFLTFAIINLAVIALRYKMPKKKRAFRIPLNIGRLPIPPVLGFVTSVVLMYNIHAESAYYGVIVLLLGLLFYGFYHHSKLSK